MYFGIKFLPVYCILFFVFALFLYLFYRVGKRLIKNLIEEFKK